MRDDILEIFWNTYKEEAWKRLNDMLDSPITTNDVNTFAVEAITSVNKDEIVKRWREQLMILMPVVEQHHMVCLLYTSPSPRDQRGSRMPSSA